MDRTIDIVALRDFASLIRNPGSSKEGWEGLVLAILHEADCRISRIVTKKDFDLRNISPRALSIASDDTSTATDEDIVSGQRWLEDIWEKVRTAVTAPDALHALEQAVKDMRLIPSIPLELEDEILLVPRQEYPKPQLREESFLEFGPIGLHGACCRGVIHWQPMTNNWNCLVCKECYRHLRVPSRITTYGNLGKFFKLRRALVPTLEPT